MRNKHAATVAALLRDDARDGGRGAAGRDDVVDDQIAPASAHRIRVHLEMIEAVLELVANRDRGARQLAALAHEVQRKPKPLRERRADDEAARLDREHCVAFEPRSVLREMLGHRLERGRIREHRRDVLEDDAGLRKVRHVHDQRFDLERAHCWTVCSSAKMPASHSSKPLSHR